MTSFEKAEIRRLPKKYRPMGAWGYFWHSILYSIPVIGLICLIWGACSDKKISRRSFARSYFVSLIFVLIIVGAVVALALTGMIDVKSMTEAIEQINPSNAI